MYCCRVIAQFHISVLKRKLDLCIRLFDPYLLRNDLFTFTAKVDYIGAQNGKAPARHSHLLFQIKILSVFYKPIEVGCFHPLFLLEGYSRISFFFLVWIFQSPLIPFFMLTLCLHLHSSFLVFMSLIYLWRFLIFLFRPCPISLNMPSMSSIH